MKIETKIKILVCLGMFSGAFGSTAFHSDDTINLIIAILFALTTNIWWVITIKSLKHN